jgi:prepilin-type N-terminal cleavage/methylation domain-containing protein
MTRGGRRGRNDRHGGRAAAGTGRGFTLLELTVVVIIVSFLAAIALGKLLKMQADAERVAMDTVVGTLRSALGMAVAESIVRQDLRGLRALEGSNPMERLAETPNNYLGAFDNADPAALEDGHWYFDRPARALVYLVRNHERFSGGVANPPRARFRVELVYRDRNGNGRYDDGTDTIEGLRLAPVEAYRWIR